MVAVGAHGERDRTMLTLFINLEEWAPPHHTHTHTCRAVLECATLSFGSLLIIRSHRYGSAEHSLWCFSFPDPQSTSHADDSVIN